MFSQENGNFIRFYLLLFKVGTDLLKKIVEKGLITINKTIDELLSSQGTESRVCGYTYVTKEMKEKLYPPNQMTRDISQWDIALLCFIIQEFLKQNLKTPEEVAVNKIRDFRNKMSHRSEPVIDNGNFTNWWTELVLIINTLSYGIQNYDDNIKDISHVELDLCAALAQVKSIVQKNNDDMGKTLQSIEQLERLQLARLDDIQERVSDLSTMTGRVVSQNDGIFEELKNLRKQCADLGTKVENMQYLMTVIVEVIAENQTTKESAEKRLFEDSRKRLEHGPSHGPSGSLAANVDKLVDDVEKKGNKLSDVKEGSVILEFACPSLDAMLQLMEHWVNGFFQEHLKHIKESLEDIIEEKIDLDVYIPRKQFENIVTSLEEPQATATYSILESIHHTLTNHIDDDPNADLREIFRNLMSEGKGAIGAAPSKLPEINPEVYQYSNDYYIYPAHQTGEEVGHHGESQGQGQSMTLNQEDNSRRAPHTQHDMEILHQQISRSEQGRPRLPSQPDQNMDPSEHYEQFYNDDLTNVIPPPTQSNLTMYYPSDGSDVHNSHQESVNSSSTESITRKIPNFSQLALSSDSEGKGVQRFLPDFQSKDFSEDEDEAKPPKEEISFEDAIKHFGENYLPTVIGTPDLSKGSKTSSVAHVQSMSPSPSRENAAVLEPVSQCSGETVRKDQNRSSITPNRRSDGNGLTTPTSTISPDHSGSVRYSPVNSRSFPSTPGSQLSSKTPHTKLSFDDDPIKSINNDDDLFMSGSPPQSNQHGGSFADMGNSSWHSTGNRDAGIIQSPQRPSSYYAKGSYVPQNYAIRSPTAETHATTGPGHYQPGTSWQNTGTSPGSSQHMPNVPYYQTRVPSNQKDAKQWNEGYSVMPKPNIPPSSVSQRFPSPQSISPGYVPEGLSHGMIRTNYESSSLSSPYRTAQISGQAGTRLVSASANRHALPSYTNTPTPAVPHNGARPKIFLPPGQQQDPNVGSRYTANLYDKQELTTRVIINPRQLFLSESGLRFSPMTTRAPYPQQPKTPILNPAINPIPDILSEGGKADLRLDINKQMSGSTAVSMAKTAPVITTPKTPKKSPDLQRTLSHAPLIIRNSPTLSNSTFSPNQRDDKMSSSTSRSQFEEQEEAFRELEHTAEEALSQHSDPEHRVFLNIYDHDDIDKPIVGELDDIDLENPAASLAHMLDSTYDEKNQKKFVKYTVICNGIKGVEHMIELFKNGAAWNSLNAIATALSDAVGKPVRLEPSLDLQHIKDVVMEIKEKQATVNTGSEKDETYNSNIMKGHHQTSTEKYSSGVQKESITLRQTLFEDDPARTKLTILEEIEKEAKELESINLGLYKSTEDDVALHKKQATVFAGSQIDDSYKSTYMKNVRKTSTEKYLSGVLKKSITLSPNLHKEDVATSKQKILEEEEEKIVQHGYFKYHLYLNKFKKELKLRLCGYNKDGKYGADEIAAFVQSLDPGVLTSLETLRVETLDNEQVWLDDILTASARTLKCLTLSGHGISLSDISIRALTGLTCLQSLHLESFDMTPNNLIRLYAYIGQTTTLTQLKLGWIYCFDDCDATLDLHRLNKLKTLHLYITPCRELHVNPACLEKLDMVQTHREKMTARASAILWQDLRGAPVLSSLDLFRMSFCQELIQTLPTLTQLQLLHLRDVDMNDVIPIFSPMTKLKRVELEEMKMSPAAWKELFSNVDQLPQSITVQLSCITMSLQEWGELLLSVGYQTNPFTVELVHCEGPSREEWQTLVNEIKSTHTLSLLEDYSFQEFGGQSLQSLTLKKQV